MEEERGRKQLRESNREELGMKKATARAYGGGKWKEASERAYRGGKGKETTE